MGKSPAVEHAKVSGKPIIDATGPAILCVNSKDVSGSTAKDPTNCALARAVKRNYKTVLNAYFFRSVCWLEYEDKMVRYALPVSVQKEIVAFDRSQRMEPGNYRLRPPQPSARRENIKKRSRKFASEKGRGNQGSTNIKRGFKHRTTDIRGLELPQ